MSGKKVIVQGTWRWIQPQSLENLFSEYGRAKVYMYTEVAHVIFENENDALRACNAANNHAIRFYDEILRLTLVSGDHGPIEMLDDLSLIKIFSVLDKDSRLIAEQVCKRWRKLALQSWSETKILVLKDKGCTDNDAYNYIIRCGRYLEQLILPNYTNLSLEFVKEHCENLKFIAGSAKFYQLENSENLSAILLKLAKLRSLKVTEIASLFHLNFLDDLPEDMVQMGFIVGAYSHRVQLSIDLSRFRDLKSLALGGFHIEEGALRGLETLENLTGLFLTRSTVHRFHFESIQRLTQLQALSLFSCRIDDDLLINIVQNNRGLKDLQISNNNDLTDRSLMTISTLPELEVLRMSNLDRVEMNFMDAMPELQLVNCNHCRQIKNEPLRKILQTSPKLKSLEILECCIDTDFFDDANAAVLARDNAIPLKITTSCDYWNDALSPLLEIISHYDENDFYDGATWASERLDDDDYAGPPKALNDEWFDAEEYSDSYEDESDEEGSFDEDG